MKSLRFLAITLLLSISTLMPPLLAEAKVNIVAAENIYGSIAQSVGGNNVSVQSILNNPNQDPHLFSINPKTAQAFQQAQLIIINGAGYDPWADNLTLNSQAKTLIVAKIIGTKPGANPHLWYSLQAMIDFVKQLSQQLILLDPAHKAEYTHNTVAFLQKLNKLQQQQMALKQKLLNAPVTATEPIAGYLADDLGLKMLNKGFQLSVMNDVEPSIHDRIAMIQSLKQHQAKLLIFNQQVLDPISQQMKQIAQQANIPVVGVTELLPAQQDYLSWMANNIINITKPLLA